MRKTLSIIALCLIAVLAATIIVLACVSKNYNPKLLEPDYIQISVNKTSGSNTESYYKNDGIEDRKTIYDEVMKLYNASFDQKIMSGIFQGIIFDKTEIIYGSKSKDSILSSGTFITFNYENEQTLKLNGEVYKNPSNNQTNIKYKTLYVEVKDTTAMTDVNIYVKDISNNYCYYRYVVKAEQAELFKYINEKV